jgi:hypothetical protein
MERRPTNANSQKNNWDGGNIAKGLFATSSPYSEGSAETTQADDPPRLPQ